MRQLVEDLGVILESSGFLEEKTFQSMDFSPYDLKDISFENCLFTGCRFQNMLLSHTAFRDCEFRSCEFLLVKMNDTILNDTLFKECKIMGVNFSYCNPFGFVPEFRDTLMSNAVFSDLDFRKGIISSCRISESDFTGCDLRQADFSGSLFDRVMFHDCNLERADLREAEGYSINPESNRIRSARFSLPEAQSFLGFLGIRLD